MTLIDTSSLVHFLRHKGNPTPHIMKVHEIVPVFHVSNLEAALKYYTDVFEFSENFRFGSYAGIRLGDTDLHLAEGAGVHERPVGGGAAYIFCDEVDEYYARIQKKGAVLKTEPRDWPYGMRDFAAVDPDGNHLTFGRESEKP